ncbi:MAG: divalent-cation tolerance protein CutA [Gemmatimonadetes bacterium]|nr:divalent-cation tolerance protein CutA [Gemmatimonadota bacterium]
MAADARVDTHVRVALVTVPDGSTAERLGRILVEERLAACANIVPGVRSIYRWQGEVQNDAEVLVVLKTTDARGEDLSRRVTELHPYEVPEVLLLEVGGGHLPYIEWVRQQMATPRAGRP